MYNVPRKSLTIVLKSHVYGTLVQTDLRLLEWDKTNVRIYFFFVSYLLKIHTIRNNISHLRIVTFLDKHFKIMDAFVYNNKSVLYLKSDCHLMNALFLVVLC